MEYYWTSSVTSSGNPSSFQRVLCPKLVGSDSHTPKNAGDDADWNAKRVVLLSGARCRMANPNNTRLILEHATHLTGVQVVSIADLLSSQLRLIYQLLKL